MDGVGAWGGGEGIKISQTKKCIAVHASYFHFGHDIYKVAS